MGAYFYDISGFSLPFLVCGSIDIILAILLVLTNPTRNCCQSPPEEEEKDGENDEDRKEIDLSTRDRAGSLAYPSTTRSRTASIISIPQLGFPQIEEGKNENDEKNISNEETNGGENEIGQSVLGYDYDFKIIL